MGRKKIISEQDKLIADLYLSGKTQKSIVELTGCSYCVVRYALKKMKVYDPSRRVVNTTAAHQSRNKLQKEIALSKYTNKLSEHGFAYIEGYNSSKVACTIKCLSCNRSFERALYRFNYECPLCRADKAREVKMQLQAKKIMQEFLKEKERIERKEKHILDKENFLNESHTCPQCGQEFCYRTYCMLEGVPEDNISKIVYCSKLCAKKALRARSDRGDHIKRAIRHGCTYERGVSLLRLIERDGLRCRLCGELCNMNDDSYGNGSGPNYPSIDHVIPISKGGSHTWKNVQIAHIKCNTIKNDKIVGICTTGI